MRSKFLIIVLAGCLSLSIFFDEKVNAQPGYTADSISVAKNTQSFLEAFSNLEWEKFTGFFADDATAFFPPSAKFPYRANNKTEIEKVFKNVFDNARKQKFSAPYISIQPQDLKIQIAAETAIVTFILNDPGMLGRRTLVLKKVNNTWLIIHLHASGVPM